MLRALLAGLCEEIPTFTKLVSCLKSDLRFRSYCGFGIDDSIRIRWASRTSDMEAFVTYRTLEKTRDSAKGHVCPF